MTDVSFAATNPQDVAPRLLKAFDGPAIIVVTNKVTDAIVERVLGQGARGFVVKDHVVESLPHAMRSVLTGGCYLAPEVSERLLRMAFKGSRGCGPFRLSTQEERVLSYLPLGYTNQQIAEQLGLSPHTVKSHVSSAMRKIGALDRIDAAEIVLSEGLTVAE